jgi:hypothetical protein
MHWAGYHRAGFPIELFAPEDKPIKGATLYGKACHHGPDSIRRFKWLFDHLAGALHDWVWIHEYDSGFYGAVDFDYSKPGLYGNYHYAEPVAPFTATRYVHPPLCMDRASLVALSRTMQGMPDDAEGGFWDWYLGRAAEIAGVEQRPFGAQGFSRNTVSLAIKRELDQAIAGGAWLFHGVKDRRTHNHINKAIHAKAQS